MSSDFSVVAIIAAFNEADIIGQVVRELIDQGIGVYFMDDCSTDGTLAAVEQYRGRGVVGVERLSDTAGAAASFNWERILLRKAELAQELDATWFIHHDADEFRESPWLHIDLREGIRQVDQLGYNAIDFKVLSFPPIHDRFRPGDDVQEMLQFYEPGPSWDRVQIKCWRKGAHAVDLLSTGGHEAQFPGRRVCPVRFLVRHYPIRSQSHGEHKVFVDRRPRFAASERQRGWHVQYDGFRPGDSFIKEIATLTKYDPLKVRVELALTTRDSEALTTAAEDIRSLGDRTAVLHEDLAVERKRNQHLVELVAEKQQEIRACQSEIEQLLADRVRTHVELAESQRAMTELDAVYKSKSWRITRPLRAIYGRMLVHPASTREGAGGLRDPIVQSEVNWGDLARPSPISNTWGLDRGTPVDRYYIESFLSGHRADVRGRVLEVKDRGYTERLGGGSVAKAEVLDIDDRNPQATLVADLTKKEQLPVDQFDCFILTQTLHIIFDLRLALQNAVRLLKPGGVLLCTIPAVSRINYEDGGLESGDFWRLTRAAVRRLFSEAVHLDDLRVETYGNVRTCSAFLYGLAASELPQSTLDFSDPWFPLIHCVRAVKGR
jgi:glycosyltransferase involved in cell wall biosynthesis